MNSVIIDIPHILPKIQLESNDLELINYIELCYSPFVKKNTDHSTKKLTVTMEDSRYSIDFDGNIFQTRGVGTKMINQFFHMVFYTEYGVSFLHGGCVTQGNKSIIILGESGAGKTTIIGYLINNGFGYLSEDFLIINDKCDIIPFQRPLHFRNGGLELLKNKYNISIKTTYLKYSFFERYLYMPDLSTVMGRKYKADTVLVLKRCENCVCHLEEIPPDKKAGVFIENSFSTSHLADSIISAVNLADKVSMFLLYYNDLNEAAKQIRSI